MLSVILKTSLSYSAKNINFDLFFNKLERLMAINKRHEMYVMLCAILKTRLSYSAKNINFDLFPSKLEGLMSINKRHEMGAQVRKLKQKQERKKREKSQQETWDGGADKKKKN